MAAHDYADWSRTTGTTVLGEKKLGTAVPSSRDRRRLPPVDRGQD